MKQSNFSHKPFFVSALLVLLPVISLLGQWPQDVSDVEPDPAVTFDVLDNGFRYALMRNAEPPDRVSLRLLVEAGSFMEEEDQRGLAHFLEHMAFNGTEHFPAGEMVEYFQKLGMAFGADTNAHTSFDETVYKLELPNSEEELLRDALLLFKDYANAMTLDPQEIEDERGVILAEKRAADSPGYRIAISELDFILGSTRMAQRIPIGVESVIEKAPKERFDHFYRTWYTTDRMVFVAVGEFDEAQMVELIEEYFGALPANPNPIDDPDFGQLNDPGLYVKLHTEPEQPTVSVSIQTTTPIREPLDTMERRIRGMRIGLANSIVNRRLSELSKKEGAPFITGSIYANEWFDTMTNTGIDLTAQPENWKGSLQLAEQELRRALEYGFTEAELAEVKASIIHGMEEAVRGMDTRRSRGLANGLTSSISNNNVFTSPEQRLAMMKPIVESMAPDEVLGALREGWMSPSRFIFVSGNLELDEPEATIQAVLLESAQVAVDAPEQVETIPFAYTDFGEPGVIRSREEIEDLGITRVVFENNVVLNIKPTDFQANRVHVRYRFGSGRLVEPEDKPGLGLISDATYRAGGLEAHSSDDIRRIFAGKTVGVGFNAGGDSFSIGGVTSPKDFEDQVNLMTAFLIAPGYREEALRQAQKQYDAVYQQLKQTAQGVMANEMDKFLTGGDHRFGFPAREQLDAITLDDVREWLEEPLAKAMLEVSIVGDIDVETAIAGIQRTAGALPERMATKPRHEALRKLTQPSGVKEKQFTYASVIPKGIALVMWPTDDVWEIGQTRRLGVLAQIYSDRLRKVVREELGEAYSPSASNTASYTYEDYGYIRALVLGDPEKSQEVADIVMKIGAELYEAGTDEEELGRIMEPQLESLKVNMRNNAYWLGNVLSGSTEYPQKLDWSRSIQNDFAAITVDEINALAKEFLVPETGMKILVLPEGT